MTDFKEERLRKVAESLWSKFAPDYRTDFETDSHRSEYLTAAAEIEAEYAEEIGRLRAGLEGLLTSIDEMDPDQWHVSTVAFNAAAEALAPSTVVGGDSSSKEDHGSSRRHDDPIAGLAPIGERQEP